MHRLALRMGRTVSELSGVMTLDELAQWKVINRTEPIGDERFDFLFAHLCLRVFQAVGIKKGPARPAGPNDWSIDDFRMFKPKETKIEPTPLEYMRARFAGRVVKKAA